MNQFHSNQPRMHHQTHQSKPYIVPTISGDVVSNSANSADAYLILENGDIYKGKSFGAKCEVKGEMVFQTGLVGYTESLTDPSYTNQILVLTYPLIGNYGIPDLSIVDDDTGLPNYFESNKVHASGLVVGEYINEYSHHQSAMSLNDYLIKNGVPGISGIDTRQLTTTIAKYGSMAGKIVYDLHEAKGEIELEPTEIVSTPQPVIYNCKSEEDPEKLFNKPEANQLRILAIDCGIKFSQIRKLCSRGACVKLVPWDYDFTNDHFDRLFISNGPGDPQSYTDLIVRLKHYLSTESAKTMTVFGICLGHQLLGLAAGASTYKMKFGNRGHNIPCRFLDTQRCFITSQNHGYAVDTIDIQSDWEDLFTNCNDNSNEGIRHRKYNWWSCQFHPEANAGPRDTEWLFDCFVQGFIDRNTNYQKYGKYNPIDTDESKVVENDATDPDSSEYNNTSTLQKDQVNQITRINRKHRKGQKVLLLGSGGLSIGQSGEFDYSGSQAIKAYKESGISVILVNPNIATVQTTPGIVDEVYFLPVTPQYVERIIQVERPDYIALSFGGQTALNCGVKLEESGVLEKYGVKVLGTPLSSINDTEDREKFKKRMESIGEQLPRGLIVGTVKEAYEAVSKIGYPVLVRAAYALGGLGSGFAKNQSELDKLLTLAFANSNQVTIDEDLRGWKEVEYEIVRDQFDNCIAVCNMENIDPLGIHTGESIVVAPSQTLNDHEYQTLRSTAFKAVRELGIVGECNIQYAVCPWTFEYRIIEINARLSRSSALASKATGYPLAYIAAKLGLGYSLMELKNAVTESTCACFEPSLDYCVVKVPRWDLSKFPLVTTKIDSSMKSIGESMAISRSFEEAFQKAFRMANPTLPGFEPNLWKCTDEELREPSYKRILAVADGLYNGMTVDRIHELSKIDKWFLYKFERIIKTRKAMESGINPRLLFTAKKLGFSDNQIAEASGLTDLVVRDQRKQHDILPVVKQIDTVAGEFPCVTNYLYTTYCGTGNDIEFGGKDTVIVLGSGVYKIGSSVEFDWCAVSCIRQLRKMGKKVIVINCNPETVSTDYDEADKLYFDELCFETVMDVCDMENPHGIVVSMGGQIPNNIALSLSHQNVDIIGTSPDMIDRAENRWKFSRMLKHIGVDQPEWENADTPEKAKDFCHRVGYPCLIRPSYVLSGAAMRVAFNDEDLDLFLSNAKDVSNKHPIVVSKFINDAKEIEVDAVAMNGVVVLRAISEHVENAGVHSGDATLILPPNDITDSTLAKIKDSVDKIAKNLKIHGPFNIQFIAKDDQVKVIECNVRVSRTFPFVSKTYGINFVEIATQVMCGVVPDLSTIPEPKKIGVKVPQFSFNRLPGADILLDVEMQSTGEVACFGENHYEAYLKGLVAAGLKLPNKTVLLSIGTFKVKNEFLECAKILDKLGFKLYGTHGTTDFYRENGVTIREIPLYSNNADNNRTILKYIKDGKLDLVVNISEKNKLRCENTRYTEGYILRRAAIESGVGILTDIKCARLLVHSIQHVRAQIRTHIGSQIGTGTSNSTLSDSNSSLNCLPIKTGIDSFTSHTTIKLPGLIDVHVHAREPGHEYKEDFLTCTQSALAGGITAICAMPNTDPPIVNSEAYATAESLANKKAYCDYALFVGANMDNHEELYKLSPKAAGMKMYLNNTYGPLLLNDTSVWKKHMTNWPDNRPICVHAESETLAAVLFVATLCKKAVHVCHVSSKSEIELIKHTKETGLIDITCEVAPHHLFLTTDSQVNGSCGCDADTATIVENDTLREVRPRLQTEEDTKALWENLDIIDCFATDHAPHTIDDKRKGCPGFPGLETALPLLLTAVNQNRLTIDDIVLRYHTNPKRIFNLPDQENTYVEVELNRKWVIPDKPLYSKCGWTPFAGMEVTGMVKRVVLRGELVYVDGKVLGQPGQGRNMRAYEKMANSSGGGVRHVEIAPNVAPNHPNTPNSQVGDSQLKLYNIISADQFNRQQLRCLFDSADNIRELVKENGGVLDLCKGKVMASIFYEPSTRTRCSFEIAMKRLGGIVETINSDLSSVKKGETIEDFVRTMEKYSDILVLRSSEPESAKRAATVLQKPLINAGNGADEHPTQALLDIYTIRKELGTVNGISVALIGDLKHGRTVHSLAKMLSLYNVTLLYVSPKSLRIPKNIKDYINNNAPNVKQEEFTDLEEVVERADVLYMTRVQRERFESAAHYESVKNSYRITPAILAKGKEPTNSMTPLPIVMHPLPRNNEIPSNIDSDPRAAYFRQMENGMYLRMALLDAILNNN